MCHIRTRELWKATVFNQRDQLSSYFCWGSELQIWLAFFQDDEKRKDPHLFHDPHPQRKVGMLNDLFSANYHLIYVVTVKESGSPCFMTQCDREKVVSWQFEKESLSDKLKNLPHFQQIASARHWHFKWSNWNALTDGIFRSRRDDDLLNLSYT